MKYNKDCASFQQRYPTMIVRTNDGIVRIRNILNRISSLKFVITHNNKGYNSDNNRYMIHNELFNLFIFLLDTNKLNKNYKLKIELII